MAKPTHAALIAKVRTLCLTFPDANEKLSHGSPWWFARPKAKQSFCALADNHHRDGRFALWLATQPGAREMLLESAPEHFFLPPYVAHLGWIGVHLHKTPWKTVASVIEAAYEAKASRRGR